MANYGVLSAFEGLGKGISEVGKIGMIDALEQRRSKTEGDLEAKLKGEDRTFEMRKMEKKHGYDIALEEEKAKGKVAKGAKDSDRYELTSSDGTPLKYDDVRKAWSSDVGANLENFDPNAAISFEKYMEERSIRYRNAPPPKAPSPLAESVYRERYAEMYENQTGEKASPEMIDAAVKKQRLNKMIVDDPSGTGGMELTEPDVIDANAAGALDETISDTGEAAGGLVTGRPSKRTEAPDSELKRLKSKQEITGKATDKEKARIKELESILSMGDARATLEKASEMVVSSSGDTINKDGSVFLTAKEKKQLIAQVSKKKQVMLAGR